MFKQLLIPFFCKEKSALQILFAGELFSSLLLLLAARQIAVLIGGIFRESFLSLSTAAPVLLALFLIRSLQALLHYKKAALIGKLSSRLCRDCRLKLHQQLAFQPSSQGNISLLAIETITAFAVLLKKVMPIFLSLLVRTPVLFAAALALDTLTALLFLFTLPIAPFLLYLIGKKVKTASTQEYHQLEQVSLAFQEKLRGMLTLRLFRQEQTQRRHFRTLSQAFSASALCVLQTAFLSSFALELITTLSIAIIAVSTGFRLIDGTLAFFPAFFLLLIAPVFYLPFRQSGAAFHSLLEAHTAWQALRQYGLSGFNETKQTVRKGRLDKVQIPPAIHIQKLCWQYPPSATLLFQNFSAQFPAGKITVIQGVSGSGKTTLLQLLAGLLCPKSGTISLNKQTLHTMTAESKQKLIAYVPQEPHVFAATLSQNVSLFQPVPEERIRQALRLASLKSWYTALPQGLATQLGAGGLPVSEGQRKRLGLARALLQNRPVTLLDEPTAGMELPLEQKICQALTAFSHHRTLVIVSHRPAIQAIADYILTLAPQEVLCYDNKQKK